MGCTNMSTMTKPIGTILIEATVVGIGIAILARVALATIPGDKKNLKPVTTAMFISGFAFHVICEYTGVNAWYSNSYVALQKGR